MGNKCDNVHATIRIKGAYVPSLQSSTCNSKSQHIPWWTKVSRHIIYPTVTVSRRWNYLSNPGREKLALSEVKEDTTWAWLFSANLKWHWSRSRRVDTVQHKSLGRAQCALQWCNISFSVSLRHSCLKEFFMSYPHKNMFLVHNSREEQSVAALIGLRIHKAPRASSQQQPTADLWAAAAYRPHSLVSL